MKIRNRIVDHITIRAGELVPHPLQFRLHPDEQRETLAASLEEVGFARSLLGYRLPDGRIQLIDGHLRSSMDPDMEVTVELLDVTEDEARKLLLTIDPLAALAETEAEMAAELARMTSTNQEALQALWDSLAEQPTLEELMQQGESAPPAVKEQYLILVTCADEQQQIELLDRFQQEGLPCKALLS
jgi:ParB-like chromosome segregation protein Spo0J